MRQLQLNLAAKASLLALPVCNMHVDAARYRRVHDRVRAKTPDTVRCFVIVISTDYQLNMDHGCFKVLRMDDNNIKTMNTSSNYSSNQHNLDNTFAQNAMNQYEIKDIAYTYGNNIKESMFGDKYYTPRARTRSSTPRTDVNYAKKEDENGDKLNVDMMLM